MLTVLLFIIVLGILVFVHEAGHFLAAKASGMKVDEFGFGFPPRIFGIQKKDKRFKFVWGHKQPDDTESTVYSLNWIPLGGFVKIVGENNDTENDERSFINKPFFSRLITLLAGVIMNVILAVVLISIGYMYGLPVAVTSTSELPAGAHFSNPHVAILDVNPGSPADTAGLQAGDTIIKINNKEVSDVEQIQKNIESLKGQKIEFTIKRVAETKTIEVASLQNPPAGSGPTGIALSLVGTVSYGPFQAVVEGVKGTGYMMYAIIDGLYRLISSGIGIESLGGPVKIAQLTGQVAKLGIIPLLQFTSFLSLNLAILNTLPIPALDGGRVLFLLIEKIRGKKNKPELEQWANTIGFFALILLMVIITVRDVMGLGVFK